MWLIFSLTWNQSNFSKLSVFNVLLTPSTYTGTFFVGKMGNKPQPGSQSKSHTLLTHSSILSFSLLGFWGCNFMLLLPSEALFTQYNKSFTPWSTKQWCNVARVCYFRLYTDVLEAKVLGMTCNMSVQHPFTNTVRISWTSFPSQFAVSDLILWASCQLSSDFEISLLQITSYLLS